MSFIESQIKQRHRYDQEDLFDAFVDISRSVMSDDTPFEYQSRDRIEENAVNELLRYFGEKPAKIPDDIKDVKEKIDYACAPYGIMHRSVRLVGDWYNDACGVMVAKLKASGKLVTLIPGAVSGYRFYDGEIKKYVKVDKHNSYIIEENALVFYKPLPEKEFTIARLLQYIAKFMSRSDSLLWLILCVISINLSLNIPVITQSIFSTLVPTEEVQLLPAACSWFVGIVLGSYLIDLQKDVVTKKMSVKAGYRIQAAGMMRLLNLPRSFFEKYSPGNLASRIDMLGNLTEMTVEALSSTAFVLILVVTCLNRTVKNFSQFTHTVVFVSVFTGIIYLSSIILNTKLISQRLEAYTKENGITYDTILGIQKIRLTNSEKRAFARWGRAFAERATLEYTPKRSITLIKIAPTVVSFLGMLEMYAVITIYAYQDYTNTAVPVFFSFLVLYGFLSGALIELTKSAQQVAMIKPMVELVSPIFNTETESSFTKTTDKRISGEIELSHVYFRYRDDTPDVVRDINLKIKKGDYVGIVGTTGCGKSTLIRLMTGLEKPRMGAVYYDGNDINNIPSQVLRKNTGVVEQNGRLFQGSILSNIRIAAPNISEDELWDTFEKAGIADDIREMPMGIHTVISEGEGGLSGGQRQRLVIARALAHKPKILFFDEATSALDNITQKVVSDTLDSLNCTRVVIAHRLSTVKNCKRIIVMNEGQIVEEGTYDELIKKQGFFAELAAKQMV